jgi:hypothetical protein
MGGPISLRNIPPHALQLAHHLCEQTGLSTADLLRQAIVSGLLVEATKFAPDQDGTFGGLEAEHLAKALRRRISSAIDFLLEYEQRPYGQGEQKQGERKQALLYQEESVSSQEMREQGIVFADAIGDDLELLGIGGSFTETWEKKPPS